MRHTSKIAYLNAHESGLINDSKKQLLELFIEYGPMTTLEMLNLVEKKFGKNYNSCASLQKLVRPLVDHDLLEETKKRYCSISGNLAIEFKYTGRPARALYKPMTRIEVIQGLLQELESRGIVIKDEILLFDAEYILERYYRDEISA